MWAEGSLPVNLDPLKADLKDSLERRRIARLLQGDPGKPVGYVLPMTWDFAVEKWRSGLWEFKQGNLFLIPGDSPMGLRLPLDALPWVAPEKRDPMPERSLLEEFPILGDFHQAVARRESDSSAQQRKEQPQFDAAGDDRLAKVPHTALCIEPRDGRLHLFMPPLGYLEHYLDLTAAIELTAKALSLPVIIEGYEPPKDPRLLCLKVTPDPGVIEVNIHPAHSWDELVGIITTLYEEARLSRLGTEKFMLDGRHTGTGGGNHVTIGGATPADSPILRRPDMLRSLVTYWQHHPGLSYLFSSLFIGPTSQAPRADEGRNEQLYELELAFQQIPKQGPVPYWLVDRIFRNLLVDLTGNTHRAEFCIDKLFSPDTLSGQQGIVEFRAFDMPPHARMSVVQMLLLRTLLAWFWKAPYEKPLVRWGTELHDRWMLPHYVHRDLADVIADLERAGYPFDMSWLDPFFEFRFPHYGTVRIRDMEISLRMAIEPWNVLGEEVTRAGTARFVDSSLERLQVKASGLTDSRHVLACNGRRVLLHNTGVHGEYVGGVRYRAWQPPSALH
ncbi:MAG TPA: transglutaminase family protein, partial [Desulfosarcina sp.]|nr:transglutaminase family protein [Desulfosarcina sp.]